MFFVCSILCRCLPNINTNNQKWLYRYYVRYWKNNFLCNFIILWASHEQVNLSKDINNWKTYIHSLPSYFPLELCLLGTHISDYPTISHGKTRIPGVNDGEEFELVDVSAPIALHNCVFRLPFSEMYIELLFDENFLFPNLKCSDAGSWYMFEQIRLVKSIHKIIIIDNWDSDESNSKLNFKENILTCSWLCSPTNVNIQNEPVHAYNHTQKAQLISTCTAINR